MQWYCIHQPVKNNFSNLQIAETKCEQKAYSCCGLQLGLKYEADMK